MKPYRTTQLDESMVFSITPLLVSYHKEAGSEQELLVLNDSTLNFTSEINTGDPSQTIANCKQILQYAQEQHKDCPIVLSFTDLCSKQDRLQYLYWQQAALEIPLKVIYSSTFDWSAFKDPSVMEALLRVRDRDIQINVDPYKDPYFANTGSSSEKVKAYGLSDFLKKYSVLNSIDSNNMEPFINPNWQDYLNEYYHCYGQDHLFKDCIFRENIKTTLKQLHNNLLEHFDPRIRSQYQLEAYKTSNTDSIYNQAWCYWICRQLGQCFQGLAGRAMDEELGVARFPRCITDYTLDPDYVLPPYEPDNPEPPPPSTIANNNGMVSNASNSNHRSHPPVDNDTDDENYSFLTNLRIFHSSTEAFLKADNDELSPGCSNEDNPKPLPTGANIAICSNARTASILPPPDCADEKSDLYPSPPKRQNSFIDDKNAEKKVRVTECTTQISRR